MSLDLIILGGGQARRMGGIDKLSAQLDGQRLIDWLLADATQIGARPIVVAPERVRLDDAVIRTLEDPPFGGPVAGIAAALAEVTTPVVGIVGGDAPLAGRAIPTLLAKLTPELDGVIAVTPDGHRQQLLTVLHTQSVRDAVASLDSVRDKSVRALYRELELTEVAVPAWVMDADTPEDLATLATLLSDVIRAD